MQVDAHQHFWTLSRGDYGWLTPQMGPIHRDFRASDLAPLIRAAGVERTILVQAAPTEAETHFLLEIAEATPFVAGVVGWLDLEAPDVSRRIAELVTRPKLKGLRPMIQDVADDDWMLRAELTPAIEAMIAAGLTFDALVLPRHLSVLRRFAARYPALDIVIDHGAKPDIAGGDLAAWTHDIHAIAAETRLRCKFSGLMTEAGPGCSLDALRPAAEALIEAFGAERLMWGSDWPVVNRNGRYDLWREYAETLTAGLSTSDRDWIFGRTAEVFYGIAE